MTGKLPWSTDERLEKGKHTTDLRYPSYRTIILQPLETLFFQWLF